MDLLESAWLVKMRMSVMDCRPGADFLNAVGKSGFARYSRLSARFGNSGGTTENVFFRPELFALGVFSLLKGVYFHGKRTV